MTDDIDSSVEVPQVERDRSGDVIRRGPGCLVAFLASVPLFTLGVFVSDLLPKPLPELLAIAAGFAILNFVGRVASRHWNVDAPDAVEILHEDLTSIFFFSMQDFRLRLPAGTPLRDRMLHEALYAAKWLGTMLVFAGLGILIYRVLVLFGITS